jgi:small conductance mechanosensitive channel
MRSVFDYLPEDFRLLTIMATILVITFLMAWIMNHLISRTLMARLNKAHIDLITVNFIRRFVNIVIYFIGISAALTQIPEFEVIGHSLLAGAGIMTVVGGLASQQVLSNIVSGLLIVIFRPFKIGEKITINSVYTGFVEDITLRETILRDSENNRIIVPNSQISSQILVNANHTDTRVCKFIEIGIGYSSNIDTAMSIMQEEVLKHPLHIDNRTEEQKNNGVPAVVVRLISLGGSSVNLRAWAWADNPTNGFILECDLLLNIKRRFDAAGIEIPFPQTTVSFQKDSLLELSQRS